MNQFLDPNHREEATIIIAAVALHGLLAGARAAPADTFIDQAFELAEKFLNKASAPKA